MTYPALCFGAWGEWLKTNATAIAGAAGGRDLTAETLDVAESVYTSGLRSSRNI